jgi:AmiR/NasT family two-component response regulator
VDESETAGPWASRSQIHQATGMVVAQLRLSPEDALALLRAHAYAQDSTLAEIAASVVQKRRLDFPIT